METLLIIFEDNLKDFLIKELEQIQVSRINNAGNTKYYKEENIKALFHLFDISGKGFITSDQYKEGLFIIFKHGKKMII